MRLGPWIHRRWLTLAVLALAITGLPSGAAHAYRYFQELYTLESDSTVFREPYSPVPVVRWGERWPLGENLLFDLYDSPDWSPAFEDAEDVKRTMEEAMAVWSGIQSADIRWSVRVLPVGVISPYFTTIQVKDLSVPVRATLGRGATTYFGCQVEVGRSFLNAHGKSEIRAGLVHEFGHCLGMDAPGSYTPFSWRPSTYRSPSGWTHEPLMEGGTGPLTADDIAGASLSRPAEGWLAEVGSIQGYVLTDTLEPGSFVHVLATRVRPDGSLGESIGRMTDKPGVFVIGGLAPGDYVLSVRPYGTYEGLGGFLLSNHNIRFLDYGVLDFGESFLTTPVSVKAEEQTGPVGLTIRPTAPAGERWR